MFLFYISSFDKFDKFLKFGIYYVIENVLKYLLKFFQKDFLTYLPNLCINIHTHPCEYINNIYLYTYTHTQDTNERDTYTHTDMYVCWLIIYI